MKTHAALLTETINLDHPAVCTCDEGDHTASKTVSPRGTGVCGCRGAVKSTKVLTAQRRLAAGRYDSDAFLDSVLERILGGLIDRDPATEAVVARHSGTDTKRQHEHAG